MYSTNSISIENLILPYTKTEINIELKNGINYIKGNNGTGKTLLLDYISGIRKDNTATITGNDSIIYINQSIFFSDRLTCEDFLKFVYRMVGIKNPLSVFWNFINEIFQPIWDKEKISLLMKKQWGMLSGGEKKYIYILILISVEREWYILDEPFAFLDNEKKSIIWHLINYKVAKGNGIILTSHDNQIDNIPSRIHIIDLEKSEYPRGVLHP